MKNAYMEDYFDYSSGYSPEDVEHDLRIISQLMRGKRHINMQLAQDIYYKIKKENIKFKSIKGEEFLGKLYENMTDNQRQEIDKAIVRKAQRKKSTKQLLRINKQIAIVMSAIVFVLSVLCINWNLLMDVRTNYQAKKLQEKIVVNPSSSDDNMQVNAVIHNDKKIENKANQETLNDVYKEMSFDDEPKEVMGKFTQLYEENPDFSGWLRIPGTKIDYPVMSKAGDNDYYLDKNFEQKHDKNGLLILDYRNDVNEDKQNLIIYGHNMRTGVMFGTLKNYKDKTYCDEHMMINFDTLYEECEYKVVAAMLADVAYEDEDVFRYYDAIDISTEENFNAFKENVLINALYTTDEMIEYGDSCLILSTCDNYKEDGRFVLVAKRM